MTRAPIDDELLERHHVLVPGDDPVQQRMRLLQAQWREERGYPMGWRDGRPDGASLDPEFAARSLATFVDEGAAAAWRRLAADPATAASFGDPSVLTDLLSPRALALNVLGAFGDDPAAFQELSRWICGAYDEASVAAFGDPCPSREGRAFDLHVKVQYPNGADRLVCIDLTCHERFESSGLPPSASEDELADEMGCFTADRDALRREPLLSLWRAHLRVGEVMRRTGRRPVDYVLVRASPTGALYFGDPVIRDYQRHLTHGSLFRSVSLARLVRRPVGEYRPRLALQLDDRYLAYDWVLPRSGDSLPLCPKCRRRRNLPLLIGKPDERATLAAQRGELVLGGCTSPPANRACVVCEHEWQADVETTSPKR